MSGEFLKIRTNQIIWRKPNPKKQDKLRYVTLRGIYTTNKRV